MRRISFYSSVNNLDSHFFLNLNLNQNQNQNQTLVGVNVKKNPKRLRRAGVYCWTNKKNNKSYVGSSVNLGDRITQYYSNSYLLRTKATSSISRAFFKYGPSNFKLEILEYCDKDKALILSKEPDSIYLQNREYNILKIAGSPLGYKHSKKAKAKMIGRKLSGETKAKLRAVAIGRTGETKAKSIENLVLLPDLKLFW